MALVAVAPCQCFTPGGIHTTSPGLISRFSPPQSWTHPVPEVTIRICPAGCVCQALRAPGSKVTWPAPTRVCVRAPMSGSTITVPVNVSAGPLPVGRDPFVNTSIPCALAGDVMTAVRSVVAIASSFIITKLLVSVGGRPLVEHLLRGRHRREDEGPAGIESEMREDLGGLGPGQPVVHRSVEVIGHLRRLACRDQGADRHQAPVPRCKVRPQPEILK